MKCSLIRKYRVFTSPIYRIVVWIIAPLISLGATISVRYSFKEFIKYKLDFSASFLTSMILSVFIISAFILLMIEPIFDNFFMRMHDKKQLVNMKYLHGSSYGNDFVFSAIVGDAFRRFLIIVVNLSVSYFGFIDNFGLGIDWYLSMCLIFFSFTSFSVFLSRYSDSMMTTMVINMLFIYIFFPALTFINTLDRVFLYGLDVIALVLLVIYFYDFHKKLERSYFDE